VVDWKPTSEAWEGADGVAFLLSLFLFLP